MTTDKLKKNTKQLIESTRAPLLAIIDRQAEELGHLRAVLHQVGKDYGIEEIGEMLYPPKGVYKPIGRDPAYDFMES